MDTQCCERIDQAACIWNVTYEPFLESTLCSTLPSVLIKIVLEYRNCFYNFHSLWLNCLRFPSLATLRDMARDLGALGNIDILFKLWDILDFAAKCWRQNSAGIVCSPTIINNMQIRPEYVWDVSPCWETAIKMGHLSFAIAVLEKLDGDYISDNLLEIVMATTSACSGELLQWLFTWDFIQEELQEGSLGFVHILQYGDIPWLSCLLQYLDVDLFE